MNQKESRIDQPLPDVETGFKALDAELEQWQETGKRPTLFLRDDDAVDTTPALTRLSDLTVRFDTPLLLATIPEPATQALADFVNQRPLIRGAVHGYQHRNHSPKGEKTCELSRHRPLETVLTELRFGREKLGNLYTKPLSGLLVPPWNRIHDEIVPHIEPVGFEGLSTHAWLKQEMPVKMVNTHVDIIHWSGGKVGRELNWVVNELQKNLQTARAKGGRAIGILTHHLAHDENAWNTLERLLIYFKNKADWCEADNLLRQPPEPVDDG